MFETFSQSKFYSWLIPKLYFRKTIYLYDASHDYYYIIIIVYFNNIRVCLIISLKNTNKTKLDI